MKPVTALIGFGWLASLCFAHCPNSCSGHGKCSANDLCVCHQNWQGADCSERICPYELAFVDTPSRDNTAHYYAECSNKGLCDRKTGECKCFDGYEGKGCQRTSCPNECSGHGTCEFIDELANLSEDRRVGGQDGLSYGASNNWEWQKIRGCKCDYGFEGADCSARLCAAGDDPLTAVTNFVHEKHRVTITVPSTELFGAASGALSAATTADTGTDVQVTLSAYVLGDLVSVGDLFHIETSQLLFSVVSTPSAGVYALDQSPISVLWAIAASTTGYDVYRVRSDTGMEYAPGTAATQLTKTFTAGGDVANLVTAGLTALTAPGMVLELGASDLSYVVQAFDAVTDFTLDQYIVVNPGFGATENVYIRSTESPLTNDQYFLTYYDPYGGMWNTTAITVSASVTTDAAAIQSALRSLPMRVLEDVTVSGYDQQTPLTNGYFEDGSDRVSVKNADNFIVTFQGTVGTSGTQHLLEVNGMPTAVGSFPLSVGLASATHGNHLDTAFVQVTKEGQVGKTSLDRSELATCSNRGMCDGTTGQCTCFGGFRGLACEFQEALV